MTINISHTTTGRYIYIYLPKEARSLLNSPFVLIEPYKDGLKLSKSYKRGFNSNKIHSSGGLLFLTGTPHKFSGTWSAEVHNEVLLLTSKQATPVKPNLWTVKVTKWGDKRIRLKLRESVSNLILVPWVVAEVNEINHKTRFRAGSIEDPNLIKLTPHQQGSSFLVRVKDANRAVGNWKISLDNEWIELTEIIEPSK